MSNITLYSAVSLNHKIARADGSVAWLEEIDHMEGEDYGYGQFYESVDTTIMGHNTFRQLIGWGVDWPYPDKQNHVLTRKANPEPHPEVEFVTHDHLKSLEEIKRRSRLGTWLIGGGQANAVDQPEQEDHP